jgi:AcrR family transcriptional regulator
MPPIAPAPSPRHTELLELAYRYALAHGLAGISLRPLAAAIGSSPRVLLFLFGSKDGLVRALLARARRDETEMLDRLQAQQPVDLAAAGEELWGWLSRPEHRGLLALWTESYARSLVETDGPWAGFGRGTVQDLLGLLAQAQPASERDTELGEARRTLVLGLLRGALLDLLATGERERTTRAVHAGLQLIREAGLDPSARQSAR